MEPEIIQAKIDGAESRFRVLFDQAPFSVQLLSPSGQTLRVNAAWKKLWQVDDELVSDFILKEYNVLTDPQLEKKGMVPFIRAAVEGKSVHTPAICYNPKENAVDEGRQRWIHAYLHPIKDNRGRVQEILLIHHDVTDRIEAETNLKAAKDAAESSSQLKSAFLANMSHEIRTPLSAILGFTGLLRDRNIDPDTFDEYLGIIERSGKSLIQIVDDILDLSRVEAGRLRINIDRKNLRELLNEVVEQFGVDARKRKLKISLEVEAAVPEYLIGDRMRVKQILTNLIGNAIKFTSRGEVNVHASQSEPGIAIAISDTGIGIAPEHHGELFRPFCQMDFSSTRKFGGTGLGLALSRRLARALGGDIVLTKSALNQGSTFTLFLVQQSSNGEFINDEEERAQIKVNGSTNLDGLRILCAEDSDDNRELMKVMLERKKVEVEFAVNGREAVDLALAGAYDLILMDIQMPIMDGFEATSELRRKGFIKPVVALSAHAMKEELQKCL
ncbi:MAG: ATP-binding protein, partial [Bdellovibrionales bacterium]